MTWMPTLERLTALVVARSLAVTGTVMWVFVTSESINAQPDKGSVAVAIRFAPGQVGDDQEHAFVFATPVGAGEASSVGRVAARVPMPGKADLSLPHGLWTVEAFAKDWWVEPKSVLVTNEPTSVELLLWEAATLKGRVSTEGKESIPGEIQLTLTPRPDRNLMSQLPPKASVSCQVADGAWQCQVPAGLQDVRVRTRGFVSHYLWDVRLTPRSALDLGPMVMRRGASVVGWVQTADGVTALPECRVELTTGDLEPLVLKNKQGATERPYQVTANRRGFFQITGVPEGEFWVVASQKPFADGKAPVRVFPDMETILNEPLLLSHTAPLEVYFDPPTDPSGDQWTVNLLKLSMNNRAEAVYSGQIPSDGHWLQEGIPQGHYRLHVIGTSAYKAHVEEFEHTDAPVPVYVKLSFVSVEGKVTVGKTPLRGVVTFGGTRGNVSVPMYSDASGRFEGILPRAGRWTVEVQGEAPPVSRVLQGVEVKPNGGSVSIVLPNTLITGTVVDEDGKPPEMSIVRVQSAGTVEPPISKVTDATGEFELRGLSPGLVVLSASARHRRLGVLESQALTVDLREDNFPAVDIRLIVKRAAKVEGHVVFSSRGVPNAAVTIFPVQEPFRAAGTELTDAKGWFQVLDLPSTTKEVWLNVRALGFAFRMLRLHLHDEPLRIPVSEIAATLILDGFQTPNPEDWRDSAGYLVHSGAIAGYLLLREWALANGARLDEAAQTFVLPNMEPGRYKLCRASMAELPALVADTIHKDRCSAGTLQPGGELVLKMPLEKGPVR